MIRIDQGERTIIGKRGGLAMKSIKWKGLGSKDHVERKLSMKRL
jgi:hypothetical protein